MARIWDLGMRSRWRTSKRVAAASGLPARAFWAPHRPWFGTVLLSLDERPDPSLSVGGSWWNFGLGRGEALRGEGLGATVDGSITPTLQ
jgi:hypothetical protein